MVTSPEHETRKFKQKLMGSGWRGGEGAAGRWEQAASTELLLMVGRGGTTLQFGGFVVVIKHWYFEKLLMPTSNFLMLSRKAHC